MAHRAVLVYEDLEKFPEDNRRREILGGDLYVTPSPTPRHQSVADAITEALRAHARSTGGKAYSGPLDVVLSAQNVVEPDVIYLGPDRLDRIGERAILGVPSLFVEVLSPSTRRIDLGRKRSLYARFALPEYWIVDTDIHTIERCSEPDGDTYRSVAVFDWDMPAATIPDLALSFDEIFR